MTRAEPRLEAHSSWFTLSDVLDALRGVGMTPRGAFRPVPDDGVPDVADGQPARTLVLVGNAGPDMWQAFSASCDPDHELLDEWSCEILDDVGRRYGAATHFPSNRYATTSYGKSPYLPFQRWATRAEPVFGSPLGIHIHSEYGLWHGYRGALAFSQLLKLPKRVGAGNPCEVCLEQPCLTACPVDAFSDGNYDVPACVLHLLTPSGQDCLQRACRARRACPNGRDYQYQAAQASFHMRHFFEKHKGDVSGVDHVTP